LPTDPLVPVVVQEEGTGTVLMLAWANDEAIERSEATGWMHFWSRSRQELWEKGATSGHRLRAVSLTWDCDRDTLLARVVPTGPVCHTGSATCFGPPPPSLARSLVDLAATIDDRDRRRPPHSYVARLLEDPVTRSQKVGEEAAEVVVAALSESRERLITEAADLLFHLAVLLHARGVPWGDVARELDGRRSP
jgi:phosphoribosyl-ATP pyrophosphohydrolase/phosphoribosyl-AMP cyclohydrolase